MAKLTAAARRTFAEVFLKTMDPGLAGRAAGQPDGAALLHDPEVQEELRRLRENWRLRPEDVTRRMAAIAFGRANDCVRLALEPDCDVSALDLTLLSEIRRSDKGVVEIKLADRMAALEYLAEAGRGAPAEALLAALDGAEAV